MDTIARDLLSASSEHLIHFERSISLRCKKIIGRHHSKDHVYSAGLFTDGRPTLFKLFRATADGEHGEINNGEFYALT